MIRLAAAAAAAAVLVAVSAGAAASQEYRIPFGDLDLGSSDGVARFDQRVDRLARAVCTVDTPLPDAQCVRRFRVEAVRKLPDASRMDYARTRHGRVVVQAPTDPR